MSVRIFSLIVTLLIASQTHASLWENLWSTPDQQGQRLMQQGHYSLAKEKFKDENWSATAAYRAGDYEEAARQFQALQTERGHYNQGNALAHLGQYEKAIAAYDKALALNPTNQDALDNRQLLKELMKKDKNKKQKQEKQNKNQQDKDKQDKDKQNKDQDNKDKQDKDQNNKDRQDKDKQNKGQDNKDKQDKDKQNKDQNNKDQNNKDKQDKDKQNNTQNNKEKQDKDKQEKAAQTAADKEKQQANDQWLKLIPDDPGGLLREKFLRDHLRRERGWYQ